MGRRKSSWGRKEPLLSSCPYVGGGQKYGPVLGTVKITCRIIIGIQKGTIILTTNRVCIALNANPKKPLETFRSI